MYDSSFDCTVKLFNTSVGFLMPLASSFLLVLTISCTPSPCERYYSLPFLRLSLSIQGSQTTMGAVYPCPSPGLGYPQLVSEELAFYAVGADFRHLPLSCGCLPVSIAWRHNCEMSPTTGTARFNSFRSWSADPPALTIVQAV